MSTLLGIDIGTSSAKAVLVTADGEALGRGQASYPLIRSGAGWVEQDPEAWWRAVGEAIRAALKGVAACGRSIRGVGLSGQMHGTVLLDGRMRPLRQAVIWPDTRSRAEVREIEEIVGRDRLISLTGSPAATGFQAATLRWIKAHEPDMWREARYILLPKDYVRLRMVGEPYTDPSDASGTLLFNLASRSWCRPLMEALEIEPCRLPGIAESSAVVGGLASRAASELGLDPYTPVIVGAADTAAGALGAGVTEGADMLVTLSTGGQLVQPCTRPSVDAAGRMHTFCAADSGLREMPAWYHLGAVLSAGGALAWLRDNVFGMKATATFHELTDMAARVPAGASGLLFLPYLLGERTSSMEPVASGVLLGLRANHGQAEIIRAVMEGVALACFETYHVLVTCGSVPSAIRIAGGGAESRCWRQIVADVFGLPVRHLRRGDHSARGAAMLAGQGIGAIDLHRATRNWPEYGSYEDPNPAQHALYAELYELFQEERRSHRAAFARLRAVGPLKPPANGSMALPGAGPHRETGRPYLGGER